MCRLKTEICSKMCWVISCHVNIREYTYTNLDANLTWPLDPIKKSGKHTTNGAAASVTLFYSKLFISRRSTYSAVNVYARMYSCVTFVE
jgi:hypothetical protein